MRDEVVTDQHGKGVNDKSMSDIWNIHQLTMEMAYFYAETQPLMIYSFWVASGCPSGYAGPMGGRRKKTHIRITTQGTFNGATSFPRQ